MWVGRRAVLLLQHMYFWRVKRGTKPAAQPSCRKGTASQRLPAARATTLQRALPIRAHAKSPGVVRSDALGSSLRGTPPLFTTQPAQFTR